MTELRFRDLPLFVRVASVLSIMSAWIWFEQLVIERYGINRYMPYYSVANACVYDLTVFLLLVTFWILAHRSKGGGATQSSR